MLGNVTLEQAKANLAYSQTQGDPLDAESAQVLRAAGISLDPAVYAAGGPAAEAQTQAQLVLDNAAFCARNPGFCKDGRPIPYGPGGGQVLGGDKSTWGPSYWKLWALAGAIGLAAFLFLRSRGRAVASNPRRKHHRRGRRSTLSRERDSL